MHNPFLHTHSEVEMVQGRKERRFLIYADPQLQVEPSFFRTAIEQLRGDVHEPVLCLADGQLPPSHPCLTLPHTTVRNGSRTRAAHRSATLAHVLVWGGPRDMLSTWAGTQAAPVTQQPRYHLVWTWCPVPAACQLLSPTVTRIEVMVAQINDSLRVRSSLAAASADETGWILPPAPFDQSAALPRGSWRLPSGCVSYARRDPEAANGKISAVLAQHGSGGVLWPIPWPPAWDELGELGDGAWSSSDWVSAWKGKHGANSDEMRLHLPAGGGPPAVLPENGSSGRVALVGTLSMDNLFHALYHAIPTLELYQRARQAERQAFIPVLPRFTRYWSDGPAANARSVELLLRGLGLDDGQVAAAKEVIAGLTPGARATEDGGGAVAQGGAGGTARGTVGCFDVLYGGHGELRYGPSKGGASHRQRHAQALATQIGSWRQSVAATVPQSSDRAERRILFVLRRPLGAQSSAYGAARMVVNEAELMRAVDDDPSLGGAVHFTRFEEVSLAQQMRMVLTSRGLVSVHGQALAHLVLLRGGGGSSVGELLPRTMWLRGHASKHYFRIWAAANNLSYFRVVQDDSPGCAQRDFQVCGNVTVNSTAIRLVLQAMLTLKAGHTTSMPPLRELVTRTRVARALRDAHATGVLRDHSVFVGLASAAGQHGRNVLQPEYVEALSSSQIVVTCNPDGWEGDSRLGEALASGALVFADAMLDLPPGLHDGVQLRLYNSTAHLLQQLERTLKAAPADAARDDRIALAGSAARSPALWSPVELVEAVYTVTRRHRLGLRPLGEQPHVYLPPVPVSLADGEWETVRDGLRRSTRLRLVESAAARRRADATVMELYRLFLASNRTDALIRAAVDEAHRAETPVVALDFSDNPHRRLSHDPRIDIYFKRSRVDRRRNRWVDYQPSPLGSKVVPLYYPIKTAWGDALRDAARSKQPRRNRRIAVSFLWASERKG